MNGMNRLAWCDGASRCESGNRAAAMLRPAPGRRSRGGAPGGALALLLALAVLALAVPSKAQASVLVSNLNQAATSGGYRTGIGTGQRFQDGGTDDLAQGFMTGTNADGYTLTSIDIPFAESISAADIADLTVSIHADDGSGNPAATALFALDKPASIDGNIGSVKEPSRPTGRPLPTSSPSRPPTPRPRSPCRRPTSSCCPTIRMGVFGMWKAKPGIRAPPPAGRSPLGRVTSAGPEPGQLAR